MSGPLSKANIKAAVCWVGILYENAFVNKRERERKREILKADFIVAVSYLGLGSPSQHKWTTLFTPYLQENSKYPRTNFPAHIVRLLILMSRKAYVIKNTDHSFHVY